jgi:hypothetical protein
MSYAYPSTLPRPLQASFTPAPRLRRSDLPGLAQQAGRERDFRGTQTVGLLFTSAEAQTFKSWHKVDLRDGGLLWHAAWPLPPGWEAAAVRKFTKPLAWQPQEGGLWRVAFECEVLGRYAGALSGAYDIANNLDGTWALDGTRYLFQYVRPVT